MAEKIVITTLVENSVSARGLLAEHGLCFHFQVGSRSLLFDTGQSDLLLQNAIRLRLSLAETEAIVLSHGHNDHTGGITAIREVAPGARLFLHPAALAPKFAANPDGTGRFIGMHPRDVEALCNAGGRVAQTAKVTEIMEGVFVTGEIPRVNGFEDTGGRFFLDAACTEPDPLAEDQALFCDTADGLVVVLGCAHSGVVNPLDQILPLAAGRPIHTLLGGMHLMTASPERMEQTIAAFRRLKIQRLVPAHCTGLPAVAQLWAAFPDRCAQCSVSASFCFHR